MTLASEENMKMRDWEGSARGRSQRSHLVRLHPRLHQQLWPEPRQMPKTVERFCCQNWESWSLFMCYSGGADGVTKCSSMCSGSGFSLTRSPPKRGLTRSELLQSPFSSLLLPSAPSEIDGEQKRSKEEKLRGLVS